ncbi:hypothetical protein ACPOL_5273 [Acidisarcina polymorpha]|uniref:Uncharacterized protein n=1 Tax=Acidisarcina polymorpha TaxID=2211140 RepID=A0A2Z5G777_9BACT|nr:hypothetical protein [Acidisarcina polymorpha]AXC14525.1 hypothetical protein ACPOL_5273 [Acidisarcina polymorpha]
MSLIIAAYYKQFKRSTLARLIAREYTAAKWNVKIADLLLQAVTHSTGKIQ